MSILTVKNTLFFCIALALFVTPFSAQALGVPFGGRVISPSALPCLNMPNAFSVEMIGFWGSSVGKFNVITVPGFSRSYAYGPLKFLGQFGLGTGIPDITCVTGISTSVTGLKIDSAPGHGSSLK